jgi:hypothetical protein
VKKKTKRFTFFMIALVTIFLLPFSSYLFSYTPTATAKDAYQSSIKKSQYYYFESNAQQDTGIIYYPGGLVSPLGYASFAKALNVATGMATFVTMPLFNLAITSIQSANQIIEENPEITNWIIGGHSLGGSAAAFYTIDHLTIIKGLYFLGSYTTANADFSTLPLKVLSITASEDRVLNEATYLAAQIYLPLHTQYETILGGNHSQYGDYGLQRGDGEATISTETQHAEIIARMLAWLAVD